MDVDEDAWELSKENVAPLRSGRRMGELRKALQKDVSALQNEAQFYEVELRNAPNEDAKLLIWYRYITWREQNYPQNNQETIDLMQKCVLHFQKINEFKQNQIYIDIWLKMVERFEDADKFFTYMFDNEIGTSLAKFYKAWADHCELIGSTKKADELYVLGINRDAYPVEYLKNAKRDFDHRLLKKTQMPHEVEDTTAQQPVTRTVLGSLKPQKSGRVGNERMKNTSSSRSIVSSRGSTNSTGSTNTSSTFQIYGDDNIAPSITAPTGQMKHIPANNSLYKENRKAMETVKGAKVRNMGGSVSSAPPAFEIYQEEEEKEVAPTSDTPRQVLVVSSRKPLSTKKREEKHELFYKAQKSDPNTVVKYCKHEIYDNPREVSFEELKARLPKYRAFLQPIIQKEKARSSLAFQDVQMTENNIASSSNHIDDVEQPMTPKKNQTDNDIEMPSNSNTPVAKILSSLANIADVGSPMSESTSRYPIAPNPKSNSVRTMVDNDFEMTKCMDELDMTMRLPTQSRGARGNEQPINLEQTICRNKMLDELDMTAINPLPSSRIQPTNDNTVGSPLYESTSHFGGKQARKKEPRATENLSDKSIDVTRTLEELDATNRFGNFAARKEDDVGEEYILKDVDQTRSNLLNNREACNTSSDAADCSGVEPFLPNSGISVGNKLQVNILNESLDFASMLPESSRKNSSQQQQQQKQQQQQEKPHQKQQDFTSNPESYGFSTTPNTSVKNIFVPEENTNIESHSLVEPSPTIASKKVIERANNWMDNLFTMTLDADKLATSFEDFTSTKSKEFNNQFKIDEPSASTNECLVKSKGFSIFEDADAASKSGEKKTSGFQIYQENTNSMGPTNSAKKPGFSIFQDAESNVEPSGKKASGFQIFQDDGNSTQKDFKKPGFSIFQDSQQQQQQQQQPRPAFNLYRDPECLDDSHPSVGDISEPKEHDSIDEGKHQKTTQFFPEEITSRISTMSFERPASTPAAPNFKGSLTFSANISSVPSFEQSVANLSTIQECSGESKDSDVTSGDGESTEYRPVLLQAFSTATMNESVERVLPHIFSLERFLDINGSLPKLIGDSMELRLGPQLFRINKQLRKGGSQSTYKAMNSHNQDIALTICTSINKNLLWNFYMTSTIHERLNVMELAEDFHKSYIQPSFVYKYSDAICFESPYFSEGSLMELIALYKKHNQNIDEALVLLYAYEILLIVHTLHQINIIHGDLHPTKFLLGSCEITSRNVNPFSIRALTLFDFGKSIDLSLLPENTWMVGSNASESFECPLMKNGKPWKYQVDYYAAAATIHMLVFQNHMNTFANPKTGMLKICNVPRSDWNEKLWSNLFSTLINTTDDCRSLLQELEEELLKQTTISKLEEAIMNKNDLLMNDD